jgi:hypothetical protein
VGDNPEGSSRRESGDRSETAELRLSDKRIGGGRGGSAEVRKNKNKIPEKRKIKERESNSMS